MSDYTPSTEEIRERWLLFDGGPVPADHAEFDRWIAEVERAAAETAWDDGRAEGFHRSGRSNPYRKETR